VPSLIQIPGVAVRIDAEIFRTIISQRPLVERLIHQHTYTRSRGRYFTEQPVNRIHSMEERCARWLLMTHDRAGEDTFPLTQEFLSHMTGGSQSHGECGPSQSRKCGFCPLAFS
jgi:CRP-like cAMP-binding protein